MAVKVLMTWDIAPERDQEYFEFIIGEWVPGVQRLGMQPSDAWATLYGSYPQIQVGLLVADVNQARRILKSNEWGDLQDRLFGYVKNFSYKVVPARNGFQF
jgi:class 3 adenylate cyclase